MGGMIYVLFRPQHLLMFDWIETIGLTDGINTMRERGNILFPEWIIYSLPDGLWIFSYSLCIGSIWEFEIKKCIPALLMLPAISVFDEILQSLNMVPGTFDLMDIFAYSISSLIGIGYIRLIKLYLIKNSLYEI